jgi:hypothetical protein
LKAIRLIKNLLWKLSQLQPVCLKHRQFFPCYFPVQFVGAPICCGAETLEATMFDRMRNYFVPALLAGLIACCLDAKAVADDATAWRVSKSSGAVWMTTPEVQQVSLTNDAVLKPGDTIRTGSNGRVLLTRGEASMLIAPNSVISLPAEQKDDRSTTIYERAGSVLFRAEKRNFKHFQVETPYLAAIVKGTQFRVSLTKRGAGVEVLGGQVEVTDFRTGQYALVLPGQSAKVSKSGDRGLSLSGPHPGPVRQGTPRTSPFEQIQVPKGGLAAPAGASDGKTVALGTMDLPNKNIVHITAPLGAVTLDVAKATDGLARDATAPANQDKKSNQTIWSNGALTPGSNGTSQSLGQGGGIGSAGTNGIGGAVSTSIAIGSSNANGGNAIAGGRSRRP